MLRVTLRGLLVVEVLAISNPASAHGTSGTVSHLLDVARDLFPEVDSERLVPAPKPGDPAAVLTARLRLEAAIRRVRQASERARAFPGGAVAGPSATEGPGIRLAIRASSGREIGSLLVLGSGREVRIEVHLASAEGAPPPVESLPALPVAPEPVMRAFPLQD